MAIQDEADKLTPASLDSYLSRDPFSLESNGGKIGMTPLAAACLGGYLNTVKLLLSKGANPNTQSLPNNYMPLYYAIIHAPHLDKAAIIQALLNVKPDLSALCNGKHTPLMVAIVMGKDQEIVDLLIDSGAPVDDATKKLAKTYKIDLRPKAERNSLRTAIVDLIVSLVLLIIAYANQGFVKNVVGGVTKALHMKNIYGISGDDSDQTLTQAIPKPQTVEGLKNELDKHVKGKEFQQFFGKDNQQFFQTLAEKATALRDDPTTDLGKPENLKRLTRLSLYKPVIYCDDSGSMNDDGRYDIQRELVKRIARITTKIVPDEFNNVDLRFINNNTPISVPADAIDDAMGKVRPSGGTKIGTNLRSRILEPIVYRAISTTPVSLTRPLLVCIITDGCPGGEDVDSLKKVIIECKLKLVENGYEPRAVVFCINQIGDDSSAQKFLEGLSMENQIKDVIYCTTEQLDSRFRDMKEQERVLESWLLDLLTKPIMDRDIK